MDPKKFRTEAAKHADRALSVAAEIMDDPELSPAVRLEASKWLTKVADLEPKASPQSEAEKFSIIINFEERAVVLPAPQAPVLCTLEQLLDSD